MKSLTSPQPADHLDRLQVEHQGAAQAGPLVTGVALHLEWSATPRGLRPHLAQDETGGGRSAAPTTSTAGSLGRVADERRNTAVYRLDISTTERFGSLGNPEGNAPRTSGGCSSTALNCTCSARSALATSSESLCRS